MELGNSGASSIFPKLLPLRIRQAIIAAVEQFVRRLVLQDAVDGIRRLPDVWRRVLPIGGDYFDH